MELTNKLIQSILMNDEKDKVRNGSFKNNFIKVYEKDLKHLLDDDFDLEKLGLLTFLSNFIGYEDNALYITKNKFMTQKDIVKLIKISKTVIARDMKYLEDKGLITKIHNPCDHRKFIYYINPSVFHKGIKINKFIKEYFDYLNNKINILESQFEELLMANPEIIEEGLAIIDNQVVVDNGRIDILGRDYSNKLCIIELKVVEDDDKIINQSVYYPTQFEEPSRMITIAPGYTNKIFKSLKSLGYVEMKTYRVDDNGEIKVNNYNH